MTLTCDDGIEDAILFDQSTSYCGNGDRAIRAAAFSMLGRLYERDLAQDVGDIDIDTSCNLRPMLLG
jgi:hypothetical protein